MLSQPRESPGNATASWGPSEPPGRARLIAFLPLPAGIPPPPPLPVAGTPGLSRASSRARAPGRGFLGVFGRVFLAPKFGA